MTTLRDILSKATAATTRIFQCDKAWLPDDAARGENEHGSGPR